MGAELLKEMLGSGFRVQEKNPNNFSQVQYKFDKIHLSLLLPKNDSSKVPHQDNIIFLLTDDGVFVTSL